jgi:hypothetical protein
VAGPAARRGNRPPPSLAGWTSTARTVAAGALLLLAAPGCDGADPAPAAGSPAAGAALADPLPDTLPDSLFAALHARISEEGQYFDTDNLISNETGYLNVLGALRDLGLQGGAYAGVGPDQNFSYIAELRPRIAFIVDVRRDNVLHHLLLKALVERSPTRVEFLSALHGRPAPPDPASWVEASVEEVVAWVDGRPADPALVAALEEEVAAAVRGYGIPVSEEELATLARFHRTFVDAGLDLRFTSHGRRPRPYYPTSRELVLETDAAGRPASWLTSAERYGVLRELQLANRVVPVVGDLAGPRALPEMGEVMREMGVELTAFYASNVEFYLWRDGRFEEWAENLAALPRAGEAVVIRSYFPNLGRHPAALPGYWATQLLQPARSVVEALEGDWFQSYGDLVTRDLVELRAPAGAP